MSRDQMSGDQIGMEIICECAAGDQMRMKIERPRSNVRDRMSGDQSSGDQMRTTPSDTPMCCQQRHTAMTSLQAVLLGAT